MCIPVAARCIFSRSISPITVVADMLVEKLPDGSPAVLQRPHYHILVHEPDIGGKGFVRYQIEQVGQPRWRDQRVTRGVLLQNTVGLEPAQRIEIEHSDLWKHFDRFDEVNRRYVSRKKAP